MIILTSHVRPRIFHPVQSIKFLPVPELSARLAILARPVLPVGSQIWRKLPEAFPVGPDMGHGELGFVDSCPFPC